MLEFEKPLAKLEQQIHELEALQAEKQIDYTKELRQLWDQRGRPTLPEPESARHDALVDARHNLARWRTLNGG